MNVHLRSRLTNFSIVIFTLLTALVGMEMMLNVYSIRQTLGLPHPGHWEWQVNGFHRKDTELIYSLQPNYNDLWKEPAFTVQVSINNIGLRGKELSPKADGIKRILILGDSMVFGWGANDDETFPSRLGELLNTSSEQFEVINAGVQGYGTDQSHALYTKRLAQLQPDLLVLCLFENDLYENITSPLYSIENDTLIPLAVDDHPVYLLGELQEALPVTIRKTATYRIFAAILAGKLPYDRLPERDINELLAWSRKKINLQIADLQEQAARGDFHLLVVGLPYKVGKYTDAGFYKFIQVQGDVSQNLLDLSRLPVWQELQQSLFMNGIDPHTNLSGYQLIAELLAEHILDYRADYFGN